MKIPSGLHVDNPAWPLLQAHVSYWGVTTGAGSAAGLTIVCADLVNEPSYDGLTVKILSGPSAGQVRTIQVHGGTTLTVGVAFTNSAGAVQQITAGILFVVLSSMTGGGGPGPSPEESLSYYGVVDAVPGANQFTIGALAGLGAGKFAGATNPYQAFVLRDAGGASAAPQGEFQPITAYVTATGVFTTAAFTAAVAVGDEILIVNPSLAGTSPTAVGKLNVAVTTIDLNQAAATYTLFTGTNRVVSLEGLVIRMSGGAIGGALTSISIQTDDATPAIIIDAVVGAVANLTNEAQLSWSSGMGGPIYVTVGKRIQLTIAGGAAGVARVCDVVAEYRAVTSGGTLV